jgi:site-specific DNA-methyltransferase (adenine-specific)
MTKDEFDTWFQQIWALTGASTREHPAPFPYELAYRLVRMFSFTGDTVLDPFCGTGTTMIAAIKTGRNSIGVEIDPAYIEQARQRIEKENHSLFGDVSVRYETAEDRGYQASQTGESVPRYRPSAQRLSKKVSSVAVARSSAASRLKT